MCGRGLRVGLRTWTQLLVVRLWCRAVEQPRSSSNDAVCVVVRSQSGHHLRDSRLRVCRVIILIYLQLVREIEHTSSSISSHSCRTSQGQGICELLRFGCGQPLLGCQAALILNEKLVDTVGDMLVDLARPTLHVVVSCVFSLRLSTYTGILN